MSKIHDQQDLSQFTQDQIASEKELYRFNRNCAILHLVQGILALAMSLARDQTRNFKLDMTTLFLNWNGQYPVQKLNVLGQLHFAPITTLFAFMSSLAHFIVLMNFDRYIKDIRRGINYFRWYEYAISSSLMIGLIGYLFGIYDVFTQLNMMSVNCVMNLFGLLMEVLFQAKQSPKKYYYINLKYFAQIYKNVFEIQQEMNQSKKPQDMNWSPFYYGCFAGLIPWITIFSYFGASANATMPGFVYAILFTYLIFFNTFPVNMYCQYKQIGKWNDSLYPEHIRGGYMYGEKLYQIQSLVSKSLLLWLVVGGANQPNAYSGNQGN